MEFKIKTPCGSCPFRSDIEFFLDPDRRREIADSMLYENKTFSCHKTVDSDNWDDQPGEYIPGEKDQHCAGALIVLAKSEHLYDNKMFRLAAILKMFDPDKLDLSAPTFGSMDEFIETGDTPFLLI